MKMNPLSRLDKLWNNVVSYYTQECQRRKSLLRIGVHSYDHIYRVWNNVKMIENFNDIEEQLNYELIQAAAILHDIGYLDAVNIKHAPDDHVTKSVIMSKEFLHTLLFTDGEINHIQKIIGGHHNDQYNQLTLEQKILLVADQLDLLGLDGTLREFIRASSKSQNRDELAEKIFDKSRQRYAKIIELKIGERLIIKKWHQSKRYLLKIIDTGPRIIKTRNGE